MQIYKQTMNRTKHTWTMTDLFSIGINLMFDFCILLFMWITVAMYFDVSRVSIWSLFMLSGNKFNVWFWHCICFMIKIVCWLKTYNFPGGKNKMEGNFFLGKTAAAAAFWALWCLAKSSSLPSRLSGILLEDWYSAKSSVSSVNAFWSAAGSFAWARLLAREIHSYRSLVDCCLSLRFLRLVWMERWVQSVVKSASSA